VGLLFDVVGYMTNVRVVIRNFKSIVDFDGEFSRVNVFIGEPATGKSNILECFGLLSFLYVNSLGVSLPLNFFVRFRDLADLFFVRDTTRRLLVELWAYGRRISVGLEKIGNDYFIVSDNTKAKIMRKQRGFYYLDQSVHIDFFPILYYNFAIHNLSAKKIARKANVLLPPSGLNLLHVIREHGELRELIGEFLSSRGLELLLKMETGDLVIQGRTNNIVFEIPIWLVSDSLLRLFVVLTIGRIYREHIFMLEEPESKSYPYYTKILAEQIALDKDNTYIISTHNPYLLYSLLEKTNKSDIKIFLTDIENGKTIIRELSKGHIEKILLGDIDPFISVEELLDEI